MPDALFTCLGRSLLLLDAELSVVAVAGPLQERGGELVGRRVEALLGETAGGAALRCRLESGDRRPGWFAPVAVPGAAPALYELTAVPLSPEARAELDAETAAHALTLTPWSDAVGPFAGLLYHGLVARSRLMVRLFARLDELSDGPPVLLVGERGTGKELAARALHGGSSRAGEPFVVVHCDALPETLVESELFGHAVGAFAGAARDRQGRLGEAAAGTLFLDAVDELPPAVQSRLAQALAEGVYGRLGGADPRRFEARLVAGCGLTGHQRIEPCLRAHLAATCHMPPLRQRIEDVEPIAACFLARASARDGEVWELAPEALGLLLRYRWPGNVRELERVLEHACAVGTPPLLHAEDLPSDLLFDATEVEAEGVGWGEGDEALRRALEEHGWRRRETADALGIERPAFWRRLWELGWVR